MKAHLNYTVHLNKADEIANTKKTGSDTLRFTQWSSDSLELKVQDRLTKMNTCLYRWRTDLLTDEYVPVQVRQISAELGHIVGQTLSSEETSKPTAQMQSSGVWAFSL